MKTLSIGAQLARPWALLTIAGAVLLVQASLGIRISDWDSFVPSLGGVLLIAFAGFAFNDYFDRAMDAEVHPLRPIPSGRASPSDVVRLAWGALAIGLVFLCLAGLANLLIGALVAFLLVIYSPTKNFSGFIGNIVISLVLAFVIFYAYVTSGSPYSVAKVLPFGLAVFFASLCQEALKDIEDMEQEAPFRATLALKLGPTTTFRFASVCLLGSLMAILLLAGVGGPLAVLIASPILTYGLILCGMIFRAGEAHATRMVIMLKIGVTAMLVVVPFIA